NTFTAMDHDLPTNTYDDQEQPQAPALLKLLFPGSARRLDALARELGECRQKRVEAAPQPESFEIDIDGFTEKTNKDAECEERIERLQAAHKEELRNLIAEYEARIENMHLEMEKDLDRAVAEKEAQAAAWEAEKIELLSMANNHSDALEEKASALKQYYGAFAEMFDAFMDRVMAVRDAYTGTDPDSPVARAISDKIMANDSYGLDDFIVDLRASMEASSSDPASLRAKVRDAFLECLQSSSANWLNVLARFYAYGQAPFCRKALEDAGLDMPLIDRAFISLENILAYGGIDLYRPRLFTDDFNPEYHTNQPIRNIDTYVSDIASHAGPDTIVDLYLVGYDDGETQRKPVVSKFA
ncbi:MAG: hypothetical protein NC548_60265, partial [Lachnospiraceae bacterium]|nr:hypothetical protein [Lachnospiraceae bacterium]